MTNQTTSKEAFLHEPILHRPNANATTTVSSFPVFLLKLRDLMTSWPNTRSKPVTRLDHAGEWLVFLHIQIHIKSCFHHSCEGTVFEILKMQFLRLLRYIQQLSQQCYDLKKSHPRNEKDNHLNLPRLHLSLAFHFTCFSGERIYLLGVKFDKASSNFCHSKIDSWRYSSNEKECNIGLWLSYCLTFPGLGFDTMGGLFCYCGLHWSPFPPLSRDSPHQLHSCERLHYLHCEKHQVGGTGTGTIWIQPLHERDFVNNI